MIKISIYLPTKRRLDLRLVKSKPSLSPGLFPNIKDIQKTRSGNKLSRFFRHIFEHKSFRKFMGTNIVATFVLIQMLGGSFVGNVFAQGINLKSVPKEIFSTERTVKFPVDNPKITQGFSLFHSGIDFDGITGDPVYSIAKGTVIFTQRSSLGYGNVVIVDHGNDIHTLYAHLSKITTTEGKDVEPGQIIGSVGSTGRATGDHLHFEVYQSEIRINPKEILNI